jgi:transcriptional regulator with XRE-family HTH domain
MGNLIKKLMKAFKDDKDYRHGYVDEFLNVSIATQIKVLREQRKWTQAELASRVNPAMKQTRISIMENVNYSSWSINTLRKLAEAFDLTLRVSFESFGNRVKEIEQIDRGTLERPSFDDDPVFAEVEALEVKVTAASKAFPDAQERESFEATNPILSVVPSPGAGAFRGTSKSQREEMAPSQGDIFTLGSQWWETPKRARA